MRNLRYLIIIFLVSNVFCITQIEASILSDDKLEPFDNLFNNLFDSVLGWNSLYHIGAIGSTALMVQTNADEKIQNYFQDKNPIGQKFADVGMILGYFWHWLPAIGIYWYGNHSGNKRLSGAGSAGIQTVLSTVLFTSVEKTISGRLPPIQTDKSNGLFHSDEVSKGTYNSADFKFDFWNMNYFEDRNRWPSGHTATAFAFVSCMVAYYPEQLWIPLTGYPLAIMMGISVVEGDYHWSSDVVAGALTGHIIGWTIGKYFLKQYESDNKVTSKEISWMILPFFSSQGLMIACSLNY